MIETGTLETHANEPGGRINLLPVPTVIPYPGFTYVVIGGLDTPKEPARSSKLVV